MGTLYYGDNRNILEELENNGTQFDLIYLDPPFNSNANYNILFKESTGERSVSQIMAFEDTWQWDTPAARTLDDIRNDGRISEKVKNAVDSLYKLLGDSNLMAYLVNMTYRLAQLHRILKHTGSIYLHCDPVASHYLKIIMDQIFGPENFKNEIIWRRTAYNKAEHGFGPIHQTILFYGKSKETYFKPQKGPYTKDYVESFFKGKDKRGKYQSVALTGPGVRTGDSGKPWSGYDPTKGGRHWQPASYVYDKYHALTGDDLSKYPLIDRLDKLDSVGMIDKGKEGDNVPRYKFYLKDAPGVPYQDIWAYQPGTRGSIYEDEKIGIDEDVKWISASDKERLGYPTQKPLGLLDRIIRASCPEGGVVLDPFCGCGTTIHAAQKLGREWIGIDITHLAINLIKRRLNDAFPGIKPKIIGEPVDPSGAKELARTNKLEFETWAISLVWAQPVETDKGRDGVIRSSERGYGSFRGYVQVKGGENLNPGMVRDLRGTMERDKADYGILITLYPPTQGMIDEALTAGFIKDVWGERIQKIQIITIDELLKDKQPRYPLPPRGFKRAEREGNEKKQDWTITMIDDTNESNES